MISIIIITVLISQVFYKIGFNESNIMLVFIVGVMFISKFTDGHIYGVAASIIVVICYNFFFTSPYYTLFIEEQEYIVTVIILLIATIITSTSTSKVKEEAREYLLKEQRIRILYENTKKLLDAKSKQQIIKFSADSLGEILNRNILINAKSENIGTLEYLYKKNNELNSTFELDIEKSILKQYLHLDIIEEQVIKVNSEKSIYYYPILGKKNTLGVICIEEMSKDPILEDEKIILKSILTQTALAIEKENLYEKNKMNSIQVSMERTRGNLLRSISHDLRTPLASILGSSSTIIENYDKIDDKLKKELLHNIYEDCKWLNRTVENVLSVTRIDEGKLQIKKNMEVVEDILCDALRITSRFDNDRIVKVSLPDEIIVITADGLLIRQILVNLIDNAKRHTPEGSEVRVTISQNIKNTIFKISDNGQGINENDIENIFDRFYSKTDGKNLEQRGIGLGLAICKSIVLAHDGEIKAYNNADGGATFEFIIPNK